MKTLQVDQVLPVLQGTVVSGDPHQLIKHVVSHPRHQIKKHSLIFFDSKKRFTLPKDLSTCTLVSSHASVLKFIGKGVTIIKVEAVMKSYWAFIKYYRSQFTIPVIGVTGTSGKTTTKEMIASMLGDKKVVKTLLSHNALERNLHYLVQFDEDTDAAVMEMGVAGPNQLWHSARHFRPTIGIITKISTDHMEDFKSQEAYFKEKIQMLNAVGEHGTIILNTDDEYSQRIPLKQFKGRILFFGKSTQAHFRAGEIDFNHEKHGMDFILFYGRRKFNCFVPGYGTHNVYNALAAFAAVTEAGVPIETAIERLNDFRHVRSHLEFHKGIRNCLVIDDTWNTNTTSIEAALEVLRETSNGKRTVAVLGNVAEMGEHTLIEHQKIGELVVANQTDVLITVGKNANQIGEKAAELGKNKSQIHHASSKKELMKLLIRYATEDSIILMKTSMRSSYKDVMKQLLNP
ncbi:UDP-N-acetylmuramoyl-tripeptide--D-alanyl-D-alanine ligase [Peribacillus psychrosaccharolyticus]|uniref:UDP-N-acetylmuramoyl-tripeptide--D-alanyl-D-alanine ligase n=1 Tax=Peribacillus psychrosaccharolyticus TaxID=1407 RepID=A0A974NNU5_PERPY|nr:UDP-N-acetylmuramoyl-tripeptide--D-alanyl-D-alanine ligase [Peribacillus psychrosaccharolyticus]MEC2057291.1 UDP-N-acetylmuramoyl-tripeptide--D-alanyl-D-alanine ligase [Peribacillus psychrosaccharolyticus]MED3742881.1 UDP-N-acetylmuramoyl-tripeptide--D-alanyl-D-alanine ligase [Peribacillus psychrosaccharolyticus]QQT01050.1 UDP-N-acetylmuramoyl-tripeptide--D-alanyl-D-alanine ligase [Peribacillus psychrosaccharolyticus]